jgi:hypothetical protein
VAGSSFSDLISHYFIELVERDPLIRLVRCRSSRLGVSKTIVTLAAALGNQVPVAGASSPTRLRILATSTHDGVTVDAPTLHIEVLSNGSTSSLLA